MNDQTIKADGGKLDPTMLERDFVRSLEGLNAVLAYGAQKYERGSWRKVAAERYDAAARRHRRARDKGEWIDEESGLPHVLHEITSLLMMLEIDIANPTIDSGNLTRFNNPPQDHKTCQPDPADDFAVARYKVEVSDRKGRGARIVP